MTPETVSAGYLLIAVALIAAGVGIIALARSAWSERRAARATQDVIDTARARAAFRRLKALPDTDAFDPKPDLPRTRLVLVPLNVVPLRLPPADDAWLDDLLREDPLQIPVQRDGSGH